MIKMKRFMEFVIAVLFCAMATVGVGADWSAEYLYHGQRMIPITTGTVLLAKISESSVCDVCKGTGIRDEITTTPERLIEDPCPEGRLGCLVFHCHTEPETVTIKHFKCEKCGATGKVWSEPKETRIEIVGSENVFYVGTLRVIGEESYTDTAEIAVKSNPTVVCRHDWEEIGHNVDENGKPTGHTWRCAICGDVKYEHEQSPMVMPTMD